VRSKPARVFLDRLASSAELYIFGPASGTWSELVAEARQEREQKAKEWAEKVHRAEIGAIRKGLDVSEKIKGAVESVKEKVSGSFYALLNL